MDASEDGSTGHLRLGVDAALSGGNGHAFGTIDYVHKIASGDGVEFNAFANGFGGARLRNGAWTPEVGATGGLELRW